MMGTEPPLEQVDSEAFGRLLRATAVAGEANEIVSGVHPSGLRDAALEAAHRIVSRGPFPSRAKLAAEIEAAITAWLVSVSEGEIEAAARAMFTHRYPTLRWEERPQARQNDFRHDARLALEAARRVLLAPKDAT